MKLYRPFVLLFLFVLSTIALSFSASVTHAAGAVTVCDERHPCEAPSGGEVALIAPGSRPADAVMARLETAASASSLNLPFAFYATQVSSGWYHTCALTTTGGVKCWGRNDDGQLGNNTWAHSYVWVDVWTGAGNSTPLSGIVSIAVGSYHTCALTTSGGVKCWGYNSYGQLGNNSWSASSVPVDVNGLTSGVVAITAGNSDTCALMASGGVKCWGYNPYGQLGNNSTTNSNVPVDVWTGAGNSTPLSGVRAIAAGGYHTCALTAAGGLKCWGYNNLGQLGNNTWTDSHIPVDVVTSTGDSTPLSGVRMMAGGTYHTCVVTTAGGVKCWGSSSYGQLGRDSYSSSNVPVDVWTGAGDSTPLSGISAITAGENHTCALTTSGGLKCWGSGEQGQIGTSSTTPVPVNMTNLTSGVSAAAAGRYHTCVVTTGGGVQCVGDNSYGQLGNNSTTNSQWPVDVIGLSGGGARAIAAGYYYSCAVTASGGVKCWGRNDYGKLGNSSTDESHVPVDVWTSAGDSTPLSGVQAVAVNYMHTCALTTAGGVKCWGANFFGQLGSNSGTSATPVDVSGLTSGVRAVGVGGFYTCALTTGGGVKCWGNNQFGQLGNNSTLTSITPVDVFGLTSGVSAINVGYTHACALTTGGGVKCWGANDYGQLGNNSTAESHVPVDVWTNTGDSTPLSGVRAIAAGGYHTCVVTTSGGGKCWGANFSGQLGNNSAANSPVPVDMCADSTCTSSLTGVSAFAPGYFNTCALTTSGGARCWGQNYDGQVGDNSTTDRYTPVDVCADSACAAHLTGGVSEISVGFEHACALTTGGGAKCWGDNGQGGLGDNSTTIRHTPAQVVGLLSSALPIVHLFANPVQAGDPLNFTATVSGPPVDPLNGTVQFQVDGADMGSPVSLSDGSAASPSTTGLALGLHRITAIYSGNSYYNLSRSASVVQAVLVSTNADLDNLVLSSGALTPTFVSGTTVYTAAVANGVTSLTVTPTAANPNATITVNGTTVASGSASGPIALATGDNTITTIVTAQDGLTTKTYTVTVTRLRLDTTTSLTSSANPSILGQAVTFTGQVSPIPTGGTMTFKDNGVDITGCAAQPLDGSDQATCTTSALTLGSHTITAFYSGDTNYSPSDNTISPLVQTVNCLDPITVTNANDSGAGSLRQALVSLCSGGTITFGSDYTIPLGSPLTVGKNMTIDGAGRSVTISGNSDGDGDGDVRVFFVGSGVAATLAHLNIVSGTVGGGTTCSSTNCGGGIYNQGTLAVLASTIAGGSALYGGGIYNQGTLTVQASTLANNYAGYGGGGIYNQGTLTVQTSTLTGNSTGYSGGGIYNNHGNLMVQASTLANNEAGAGGGIANDSGTALKVYYSTLSGNRAGNGGGGIRTYGTWLDLFHTIIANSPEGGDCVHTSGGGGGVTSGYGLIESTGAAACWLNSDYSTILGVDPLLGPLADNGGSTQTFALLPGSPAIDAGQSAGCASDQRGLARPQGTACDIGAFESRGFTLTINGGDNQSTGITMAFSQPLSLAVSSAFGDPVGPGGVISYTAPSSGASLSSADLAATTTAAGQAGVNVAANGVAGSYTVTATARGVAVPATFHLTNLGSDLALTKTVSPLVALPAAAGQVITYTLTFSNTGGGPASEVVLTDLVPVTLTDVSVTHSGAAITATGSVFFTWQVQDLAPGQGGVITLTGRVSSTLAAPTSFTNTASITGTGDLVPTNNSAEAGVTVEVPEVTFSSASYSVSEATGQAVITVSLTAAPLAPVTVHYATGDNTATAGSDYTAASGLLTILAGTTSATFTVPILDDTLDEANETLNLTLANPAGAALGSPTLATLTIDDDDDPPAVRFSSADYPAAENGGPATITVTLSAASGLTVTVNYATSDGTASPAVAGSDYVAASGVLTFAPGQFSRTFTVDLNDDSLDEPAETVNLALSGPANAALGSPNPASLTITDDDAPPDLAISDASAAEPAGTAIFTISLSVLSSLDVSVEAATADNTATGGSDYTAVPTTTLTIPAGSLTATLSVPVLDDPEDEAPETFFVNLAQPVNAAIGDNQGLGTITSDDQAGVIASPTSLSVSEPSGTATFTLRLTSQPAASVTITLASSAPTACTVAPAAVTFAPAAWNQLQTITVTAVADGVLAGDRLCTIQTTAASADPVYNGQAVEDISVTVHDIQSIYLPLITNGLSAQPDLVIDSLAVSGGQIIMTLRNAGSTAVTDDFWVDVYFNPTPAPPPLNRTWQSIAQAGAHWGVTDPLAPGETLTLTLGGPYYGGSSSTFPAGAQVYAYVDCINYATSYGNVQESNEGNNVFGPVVSTAAGSLPAGAAPQAASAELPER